MRGLALLITAALLAASLVTASRPARAESRASEYQLQAAFLLNFARFTQWPEKAGNREATPFVIYVVGRDPFDGALEALQRQSIGGQPVRVLYDPEGMLPPGADLIYVSASAAPELESLLLRLAGRPVLLVSDIPRFAERGGHIELFTRQNKMRFRVNLAALARSRLTISSKLLRLAELVEAP